MWSWRDCLNAVPDEFHKFSVTIMMNMGDSVSMASLPKSNLGAIISMLGAVLVGSLMTSQYYKDEVGPIESLKDRLALIVFLLVLLVGFDLVMLVVIMYG